MPGEEQQKTESLKAVRTESLPTQPVQPTWSVVDDARPEVETAPPDQADPKLRAYAEWFAWMKKTGASSDRSHQAAELAIEVAATISDPAQIAAAVQERLPAEVQAPPVDRLHQSYCGFFALGSIDLQLEQAQAHQFARAASTAMGEGADIQVATRTAMAAVGLPPPE